MATPKRKRVRDYKAEEARRNELARSAGYTSRAQMRRMQKHGWAPPRIGAPGRERKSQKRIDYEAAGSLPGEKRAFTAKQRRITLDRKASRRGGTPTERAETHRQRMRDQSADWSIRHSRQPSSRYDPSFTDEQTELYYNAFINNETKASRIENGHEALRAWLQGELGLYDDVEFIERYGVDALAF